MRLPRRVRRDRRAGRPRRVAALALLAVAAAACGGTSAEAPSTAEPAAPQPLAALAAGDPLPARELPVLGAEDEVLDTADLGGPAVINFWATWCAFCVEEMPDFEAVHRDVGDQVRFIGVDREDNPEAALAFLDEVAVTYEVVEDVDGSFFVAVKGRGMPTTLFVDAEGVIRYRHAGPMTGEQLRAFIAQHLEVAA